MSDILLSRHLVQTPVYPTQNLYEYLVSNQGLCNPSDVAQYRVDGKAVTREEIYHMSSKVSAFLKKTLGLQHGDRVAIISPNSTLYTPIVLGILRAGMVCVPLNPIYSLDEFVHPFQDSDIAAFFVFPGVIPNVRPAMEKANRSFKTPSGQNALWLMDDGDNVKDAATGEKDFRTVLPNDSVPICKIDYPTDRTAFIVYSSGTSGKPKGVELTHDNLKSNMEGLPAISKNEISSEGVLIAVLPMFHIFGLNILVLSSYLFGMVMVVVPRFDLEVFCAVVQKYKVTFAPVVPPMILGLARHPIVDKYDMSSLHTLMSGAAPLGKELGDEFERRLTKSRVTQGYGLSETSPVISLTPSDEYNDHKGSCGEVFPGLEVRLVDENGKDVAGIQGEDGVPGELWVRGRSVMKGYRNNKAATSECITPDRWFMTGDVAIHKKGHLYIVDRKKELIKYKGFQVPPAELESLLLSHPDVQDVAVMGVQDKEQATELPRAYLVPKPNALDIKTASQQDKDSFCKKVSDWQAERVANYKKLRGGIVLISEVPKSAAGKILRRVLRDEHQPA
ncbi:hypothetical protein MVES1_000718 [Malassezia vespertilionis]|uniref:AMP-dependent synthetase/ligase domain-containing protein n=1 Tax=Malassezia vespertilionis TaxID=2020962 RepID=A0A2N1JGF8_9BASI|nr:uncharacterized protein MVES1_000718 [Malassezia vespertilionis]PKI85633.1 hypothetical protein MVES_000673 [Malassezia vespertilionis]WFD05388.1 hypothetical protein MVES1_000718 [Malassezia vespertilionis]